MGITRTCLVMFLVLILAGIASPPTSSAQLVLAVPLEKPTLTTRLIPPQETDPAIDRPHNPHLVVIDPTIPRRQELFLWLSGTGGTPVGSAFIVRQAGANGFHAIGLDYPNEVLVLTLCEDNADPDCFEKVRLTIIYGDDLTGVLTVTRPNSIVNRLTKLLLYLSASLRPRKDGL